MTSQVNLATDIPEAAPVLPSALPVEDPNQRAQMRHKRRGRHRNRQYFRRPRRRQRKARSLVVGSVDEREDLSRTAWYLCDHLALSSRAKLTRRTAAQSTPANPDEVLDEPYLNKSEFQRYQENASIRGRMIGLLCGSSLFLVFTLCLTLLGSRRMNLESEFYLSSNGAQRPYGPPRYSYIYMVMGGLLAAFGVRYAIFRHLRDKVIAATQAIMLILTILGACQWSATNQECHPREETRDSNLAVNTTMGLNTRADTSQGVAHLLHLGGGIMPLSMMNFVHFILYPSRYNYFVAQLYAGICESGMKRLLVVNLLCEVLYCELAIRFFFL